MSKRPTIVLLPGLLCDASTWMRRKRPSSLMRMSESGISRSSIHRGDGPVGARPREGPGRRVAFHGRPRRPGNGAPCTERIVRLVYRYGIIRGARERRRPGRTRRSRLRTRAWRPWRTSGCRRWFIWKGSGTRRSCSAQGHGPAGIPGAARAPDQGAPRSPECPTGLAQIACPTLVMVGRQDRWSPLAQHEEMAALIPNATLVVIEDSGHMSPVERPGQVSQALLRFLVSRTRTTAPRGVATGKGKPMGDETDAGSYSGYAAVRPQAVAARIPSQQDGHGARRSRQPGGVPE